MALPINLLFNDLELQADYLARTDGLPTYYGYSTPETATSEARWTIYKNTIDVNGQVTRRQVRFKAIWDNRASIF